MSVPIATVQPIAPEQRLVQLDVLRGLALLGVLLVNIGNFSGADWALEAGMDFPMGAYGDSASTWVRILLENKAAAALSLLFGAGMAIQAERAASAGRSGKWFALRRAAVLALFGALHTLLLWNLDILLDYALISLLVLPFLNLSAGRVLWAILPVLVLTALLSLPLLASAVDLTAAQFYALGLQHYGQGSWLDALQFRIWETVHTIGPTRIANRLAILSPFFIIGVSAWKAGWLMSPDQHRTALKRVFAVCFSLGLLANAVPQESLHAWVNTTLSWQPLRILIKATFFFGQFTLTLGYGAGILLALRYRPARAVLSVLAPLGRMALTQYLLQSLICTWLFHGFGLGLYGRLPFDQVLLLGLLIFVAQIIGSHLWLARFRIGPAEWLWRYLSYGRRGDHAHGLSQSPSDCRAKHKAQMEH
ncbi:MAG: DUF418 domain-containing protein [Rhodanobacteraceae bacterium]|nr:DUF418 domain-containing protein [Rhodanobacteraceae bacterium]